MGRAGPGPRLPGPAAGRRRKRRGRRAARARAARALLPSDREALLEYSLGDSSSSLWIITRHAWRRITLPARPALRARAEILRRGLADPATADARVTRAAARALYRTLVEPAEPLLQGVTHLVIAPDGPLALVPFEALLACDVRADGAPPRGAYLIERREVSYTPSAAVLATRSAAGRRGGIVAARRPPFRARRRAARGRRLRRSRRCRTRRTRSRRCARWAGTRAFTGLTGAAATRAGCWRLPEPRGSADPAPRHARRGEREPSPHARACGSPGRARDRGSSRSPTSSSAGSAPTW